MAWLWDCLGNIYSGGGRTDLAAFAYEQALFRDPTQFEALTDQHVGTLAKINHALLIGCQTDRVTYVPMDLSPYTMVIANSNKDRHLADSAYNQRRWECQIALDQIRFFASEIGAPCRFGRELVA